MTPYERFVKLNTKENLWIYILIILKRGPRYAWDMYSIIEKEFGFKPGNITPYRVLYRLEEKNYVESRLEKRKRIYKITPLGEKELEKAKDFYLEIIKKING